MHPVLFEIGQLTIYSYGLLIAVGAAGGVAYMAIQGKKDAGLTFDQANNLFLCIFLAALIGGKVFLFFESPAYYLSEPARLFTGRGFVFYGSFLFAVPTMFWYFRKNGLHAYKMLDVMAVTTCIVHIFGRLGCFMAGCCHGTPTDSFFGVTFTDPRCYADPKGVPLHPTQLYEALFILLVLCTLLITRKKRKFYGQLFLMYLALYAVGRFVLEMLRGDPDRGFVIDGYVSHAQFIALLILGAVTITYFSWSRRNKVLARKNAPATPKP